MNWCDQFRTVDPAGETRRQARCTGRRRRVLAARQGASLIATLLVTLAVGSVAVGQEEDSEEVLWAIQAPLAVRSLLLDVARVDDRLVAVGERGHILLSDDNGGSWRQVEVPTRATLTAVHFHDGQRGWVVGHDAVILRTTDGGENWERVHYAPEDETPFLDVWFDTAEVGYAIGAYGFYFVTRDGGTNWEWQPISDADFHLNQIKPAPDGRLYIAAEAGMAYRSDDGGLTWIELPSPYDGSFFGTLPIGEGTVLLFGLRGHLFRSSDQGMTWQALATDTVAMLTDGVVLDDGRIVVVGLGGVLLVSDDGGAGFRLSPLATRLGISAAVQAADGSLVLVGEGGPRRLPLAELPTGADSEKGQVTP